MQASFKDIVARARPGNAARYSAELLALAAVYFVVAKGGLVLASINPSATPIWPPTGIALAAMLLAGNRMWPAIFVGAFLANVTNAGSVETNAAIALGNTLEAVVGAYGIRRWSGGAATFDTPGDVIKFAGITAVLAAPVSATIGVASLTLAGYAGQQSFGYVWLTWWLGDLAGALLITPVIIRWTLRGARSFALRRFRVSLLLFGVTSAVGFAAFGPLAPETPQRSALAFLAILPLLLAAVYRGRRDTATVSLVLSAFAVWGTWRSDGLFLGLTRNDAFLLLATFMISTSIPSLALAADVSMRKRTEQELRTAQKSLNRRMQHGTQALAEAKSALQESEAASRLLIDSVREYAIFMLDAGGHVVSWNPGAARIKGYDAKEIMGRHFRLFYTEEDRAAGEPERALALARAEGKSENEGLRVRKDGSRFWAIGIITAIRDESGALVGFAKITRDITTRRQAQQALMAAREQLLQSQKMEAIGQLTGGVAHDFNNLLMIVSGHAEILRKRSTDPKILRAVDAILTAAQRGQALTRQLLSFARRQKLMPARIDLRQAAWSVREMLHSSLPGDIAFLCDIADGTWPVEADAAELELALVNIVVNARDAMAQGGTVRLTARNVTCDETNSVDGLRGDFVALSVADTGSGIAPDLLPKIVEPFFTTKSENKGTGLGLSQVYGFARQSGGTLVVESEVGVGTNVTVYLPRTHAVPKSHENPAACRAQETRHGRVLLVEDNAEVMEATAALLEELGYTVTRAASAAAACVSLRADARVTLVFSDIVMPGGMSGIALAKTIRRDYPTIPILLMSGYSDLAEAEGSSFPILRKPFGIAALDAAIAGVLASVPAAKAEPVLR